MSEINNGIVPKLEAEIKEYQAAWVELRAYCQRGIEAKERYGDAVYAGSVQSLYNVITKMDELLPKTVADVAPVAEDEQQPRFKAGDKVRYLHEGHSYMAGEYDTIHEMLPSGQYLLRYSGGFVGHMRYEEWELFPYTESASDDTA